MAGADRQKVLAEVLGGGFKGVFKLKHQSEAADPDWKHVRYKQSDDATGVLLIL